MSSELENSKDSSNQDVCNEKMKILDSLSWLSTTITNYLNKADSDEVGGNHFRSCNEFIMGMMNQTPNKTTTL